MVTIGILKYEEQKALAGFCCFNAVTILFTAGHRATAGDVVAAGNGFAPAKANRSRAMSESMTVANDGKSAITARKAEGTRSKEGPNHIYTSPRCRSPYLPCGCILRRSILVHCKLRHQAQSQLKHDSQRLPSPHSEMRLATRLLTD